MFKKVLVANRGEIAVRIIRSCREMGIATVAVHSAADTDSLHAMMADKSVCIGGSSAKDSYLNMHNILSAAISYGADAIHPGYGFLSENETFAALCQKCSITYIGPSPQSIAMLGDKAMARKVAASVGIPIIAGGEELADTLDDALSQAETVGYPVMVKAVSGGGGRGIRIVNSNEELRSAYDVARAEAKACFGNDAVYVEKYLPSVLHVEVQILADSYGNCIHLGERDCSLQRRNQKVVEEAPCHSLSPEMRKEMGEAAVKLAKAAGYVNAGTVEFLFDGKQYYFMEMNTRIQVEHPVTEMITGVDLIKQQIRIAAGEKLKYTQDDIQIHGHSIECRINAESPRRGFAPTTGTTDAILLPGGFGVRVDSHLYEGYKIPPFYDSMLAKVIVHADDRDEAISRMRIALEDITIEGMETNAEFLQQIISNPLYIEGKTNTRFIDEVILKSSNTA